MYLTTFQRDGASHSWLTAQNNVCGVNKIQRQAVRTIDGMGLTIGGLEYLLLCHMDLARACCMIVLLIYLMPRSIHDGSYGIQSLQRVSEMRVGHIRRVNLTKLSSQPFLLFFGDTTLKGLLVAATVLPHVVASPDNDQQEL